MQDKIFHKRSNHFLPAKKGFDLCFSASTHCKSYRNVTFKQRLGTTPHAKIYGEKADVSKFRPFGCRAYVHLNKDRREPGKHTPRAVEAIHLGFASDSNMSAYKFYVPSTGLFNDSYDVFQSGKVRREFLPVSKQ